MITKKDSKKIKLLYDIHKKFNDKRICFFDIETTGFSRIKNNVYLIGVVYYDNNQYNSIQWFDDDGKSEINLIISFIDFVKNFDIIINYNGNSFDIPFIEAKADFYGLQFSFNHFISYDIYKEIYGYRYFLGLENLKQKSVELFLKLNRNDEYDGGRLIKIYHDYLANHSQSLLNLLLLHNYEDIYGLVKICDILSYSAIINGDFTMCKCECNDNLLIKCRLKHRLKVPFSIRYENIYISAGDDSLNVLVPLEEKCLKYFYDNYKDYYYLPEEDTAIHKSVAQFVDKEHRLKAKKENCYTKKNGLFAKEYSRIFNPVFKEEYSSKELYFETNVISSDSDVYLYVLDILINISKKH